MNENMNKKQKAPMYRRNEETKNIIQFDNMGYPSCEKHGAMNCVVETRKLWRCLTCGVGVSFGSVESFDRWLEIHKDVLSSIKYDKMKEISDEYGAPQDDDCRPRKDLE